MFNLSNLFSSNTCVNYVVTINDYTRIPAQKISSDSTLSTATVFTKFWQNSWWTLHRTWQFIDYPLHGWSRIRICLQASPHQASQHMVRHDQNLLFTPSRIWKIPDAHFTKKNTKAININLWTIHTFLIFNFFFYWPRKWFETIETSWKFMLIVDSSRSNLLLSYTVEGFLIKQLATDLLGKLAFYCAIISAPRD